MDRVFLCMPALWLAAGCTGEKAPSDTAAEEVVEDTDVAEPAEEEVDPGPRVELSGTVEYEDGTAVDSSTVRVQMCISFSCYPGQIGDGGSFLFQNLEPGSYSFDVVPLADSADGYPTVMDFVDLTEDNLFVSMDTPVKIPSFHNRDDSFSEQPFDAGAGLMIHTDQASFDSEDLEPEEQFIASAPVEDLDATGLLLQGFEGQEIVGMAFLAPYDSTLSPAWGFEWTLGNGIASVAEGTETTIYNGIYSTHSWKQTATAIVDENGSISVDGGIENLSVLVVTIEKSEEDED
jgi:hypothetical protein